jgi:hypothetical protein
MEEMEEKGWEMRGKGRGLDTPRRLSRRGTRGLCRRKGERPWLCGGGREMELGEVAGGTWSLVHKWPMMQQRRPSRLARGYDSDGTGCSEVVQGDGCEEV